MTITASSKGGADVSRHRPRGLRTGLAAALPIVVTIDLLVGGPLTGLDHAVHRFAQADVQGVWKQVADTALLLGQRWVLPPIILLVVRMSGTPLLATVADDLGIFRIGLDPAPVVIATPPALTNRLAADALLETVRGWLKDLLTVGAARRQARLLR